MLIPPLVVNTKEVKQPFSSTKVHWLYFFFLILHFLHLYCYWLAPITWSVGIKHTYINKYVFCNLCQKLPMLILAWRPSWLSEEVLNVSSFFHLCISLTAYLEWYLQFHYRKVQRILQFCMLTHDRCCVLLYRHIHVVNV